jgi:raffinose/stachyose/melibiose transport system permease protein
MAGEPAADDLRARRTNGLLVARLPALGSLVATRTLGYLVLVIVGLVFLYPLLFLVNVALKSSQDYLLNPTSLTSSLNLSNFSNAWIQGNFGAYVLNTVLYSGAATIFGVGCSLFIAFPISRAYVRWSGFWYTMFVVALFLPNALIPQFQLILHLHLYNTRLGYILTVAGAGLGPFLIAGYLRSIPKELDEAASIDGCGYLRYVVTIIIPLVKPVLATAAILQAINVWNDIIGPTIYFASSEYFPVSVGLYTFYGIYSSAWTELAAAILIVASPLIVLYIFLQRYFIEGAISGAVK